MFYSKLLKESKACAKLVFTIKEVRSPLAQPVDMSVVLMMMSLSTKVYADRTCSLLFFAAIISDLTSQDFAASDILPWPRNVMVDTRPTLEGVVE